MGQAKGDPTRVSIEQGAIDVTLQDRDVVLGQTCAKTAPVLSLPASRIGLLTRNALEGIRGDLVSREVLA